MRNIVYMFLAFTFLLVGCDKSEDAIFDLSPEERTNKVLTDYKNKLIANDGLWIAYYQGQAILMKFKEDNMVEINSTFNDGKDDNTVTYRLGISHVPQLTFESYTVFHAIYNGDRKNREFEFLFDEVENDRIDFISKSDLGSEKTKLTFFKGKLEDLTKVKEMKAKLVTLSVFKRISIKDDADYIGSISLDDGKASIVSRVAGKTEKEVYNYNITATGILFEKAIKLKEIAVQEFKYDEASKSFNSLENASVSIKESMEPVFPLTPYAFGKKVNARYNFLEPGKSSVAFSNFYKDFTADALTKGLRVDRVYMRNLNKDKSFFDIYTQIGRVQFEFTFEIKENGRVYFTLTGVTNASPGLAAILKPLLDKFVNTNGHYIEGTGTLNGYPNGTFSLINADDPSLKINFYDF